MREKRNASNYTRMPTVAPSAQEKENQYKSCIKHCFETIKTSMPREE